MKLTKITTAMVALAAAAVLGTSAHAQNLTYNQGDLLIGFEQTGSANDYVVDLGSANHFIDATSNLTFALSSADLTTAFGSGWASNSQTNLVQWGVIGSSSRTSTLTLGNDTLAKNTLFETAGRLSPGTQSAPPAQGSNAAQNSINGSILSLTTDFKGETPSTGSTVALQATIESSSNTTGWSAFSPGSTAFGIGSSIEQPVSGTATGPTNSVLDLYQVNSTTSGGPVSYLGNFTLASSGVLSFNVAAAAVPEPSSYALAALAAVTFLVLRRRQVIAGQQ